MTNQHKRKGDSVFEERTNTHVVVVNPSASVNKPNEVDETPLEAARRQLKEFRLKQLEEENRPDSILDALMSIGTKDEEMFGRNLDKYRGIQDDLDAQIEEATRSCQKESTVLSHLVLQTKRLEQSRDNWLRDIDEIDKRQVVLQQQIALHQQEASQEIENIDTVEEERKRQVPRLKTQISLYASTTGIKWDFNEDELLSGSVVRSPPKIDLLASTMSHVFHSCYLSGYSQPSRAQIILPRP